MKSLELVVDPPKGSSKDLFALRWALDSSGKTCTAGFAFPARFTSLLSAKCFLLGAHLAQAGSYGLKFSRLDIIYRGVVRETDRLVFVMAYKAAFELARDRHLHASISPRP